MVKIKKVKGRQVFDSRGNPTVEAEVFSDVESYVSPPPSIPQDYDEILEDDDGYPD